VDTVSAALTSALFQRGRNGKGLRIEMHFALPKAGVASTLGRRRWAGMVLRIWPRLVTTRVRLCSYTRTNF